MKKFLSLVLALVMTMSLVTISAGAKDFTDDSKIQYEEAVDVVSALEIVDGYTDGSFQPSNTLTRGAAAKIICNLILGPTTASALSADTAPYSDVPTSNTFAGYIAFCAQQGIISGYADGSFRPSGTLTSYAFMKMLLGALGYDAGIEGYTGANWSVQVAKRALAIGLDDDLVGDFNGVKAVTREEACLYAFNTLTATMVEYDTTTTVNVNGATVVVGGSKASEVVNTAAASKQYNNENDGKMQFCEKYFDDLKLKDDEARDDFGRPANTWYNDKDKIGTYAKDADLTYTEKVKAEKIYKDLDLSKAYDYEVITDGRPDGRFDVIKKGSGSYNAYDDKVGDGNGNLIEVFEDEELIVVINTYLMQVDGDYDEDEEELSLSVVADVDDPGLDSGEDVLSSDDFDNLDTFKDEDYVLVTVADGVVQSIALAEKVTAAVTEYVEEDTVTAGGKEYSYSAKCGSVDETDYDLKEEYDLYLDSYGNVLYADGVEAEGSYVYISEFAKSGGLSTNGKVLAYAYFLDGTEDEITLNKVAGSKVQAGDVSGSGASSTVDGNATGWYRYSLKESGKYDLKTISDLATVTVSSGDDITDYSANGTEIASSSFRGNSSTKFIVVDADGDVSAYTGIKNVADTVAGTGAVVRLVTDGGSYAKYVFIDVGAGGTVKGGSNSSDLIFLMKYDKTGTDSDSDEYYRYKAIVNGEEKKVKVESDVIADLVIGGDITNWKVPGVLLTDIEYTSKGYVTDGTAVTTSDDDFAVVSQGTYTVRYKNNTVIIGGTSFYLADGAKIHVIYDDDSVKTVSGSTLEKNYSGSNLSAVGVISADDDISALYVYIY